MPNLNDLFRSLTSGSQQSVLSSFKSLDASDVQNTNEKSVKSSFTKKFLSSLLSDLDLGI